MVADPTRRAIIDRLVRGPARVTDVARPFAMSLNAAPLREVSRWAHHYEHFWSQRLDRLEGFFASKERKR